MEFGGHVSPLPCGQPWHQSPPLLPKGGRRILLFPAGKEYCGVRSQQLERDRNSEIGALDAPGLGIEIDSEGVRQALHKPAEVAAAFGADRVTSTIHSLVEVKGEIFSAAQFHMPAEDAAHLRSTDFSTRKQPILCISERLGRPLRRAHQITVAAAADQRVAELLRVADGSPVMVVLRIYFDMDDQPLAVVVAHCHPARYRLEIAFQSPSASAPHRRIKRRSQPRRDGAA